MDLVLLGAPGSGKGTQADHLQRDFGLTHIASGDLFRDHLAAQDGTRTRRPASYMARGALVPDAITIAMLRERVSQPDTVKGVLLDGFPRTMEQAIALNEMMATLGREIDAVLYVEVPDEELVERLSGRLICRECQVPVSPHGQSFRHVSARPLQRRTSLSASDDCTGNSASAARRPTIVRRPRSLTTTGLIKLLVTVPGHGSVDDVKRATLDAVRRLGADRHQAACEPSGPIHANKDQRCSKLPNSADDSEGANTRRRSRHSAPNCSRRSDS